jgi:hydroxylamine dehydrogenase
MLTKDQASKPRSYRLFSIIIFTTLFILGIFVLLLIGCNSGTEPKTTTSVSLSIPTSLKQDPCYVCHQLQSPGITEQFATSIMTQNAVTCRSCHEVAADYPGAQLHNDFYRLAAPTPAMCQGCHHADQVNQFMQSRHALPAYVAVMGSRGFNAQQLAAYQSIPEGNFDFSKTEHPLAVLEGDNVITFACMSCHSIGQTNADGSVGRCQSCHIRHTFSIEQARKPETCNACHIGPDHPQWEIYQESAHGIRYATDGQNWNWSAAPGKLTTSDMPAPTCATCHISAFGKTAGTHDVGERLTSYLFSAITTARPSSAQNQQRMQSVCLQCHSADFVIRLYDGAGKVNIAVNDWVKQSDTVMNNLKTKGLLTTAPFDEPIDYTYFEIWHHWGRTAKFGAWMDGPDYAQWHGAYEVLKGLAELQASANEKLATLK